SGALSLILTKQQRERMRVTLTNQKRERLCVILTKQKRERVCHPDRASIASGRKDLGQLRAREAGSGL
ncbi:MAG: hypothetical protein WA861_13795, partial [Candidatus Binatus sp.]